jgi:hypothetical protein
MERPIAPFTVQNRSIFPAKSTILPVMDERSTPLFRKIDRLQIPVPDLEAGLAFYRDRLGHELIWRTDAAAGLHLPDSDTEIVIVAEQTPTKR